MKSFDFGVYGCAGMILILPLVKQVSHVIDPRELLYDMIISYEIRQGSTSVSISGGEHRLVPFQNFKEKKELF